MASSDKELEEQLMEVGNRLLEPPASVDELLSLLDQVENFLSRVEQSPTKSMQTALSPSTKALVADKLLRHPDIDVKVAVASCISEITRITAPDAPYDDDQMKDVFQLIVSSFEHLSDKSSRSYNKRTLILETVAKVRSCVVMLDLECDGLIIEMFQHLLKAIRDSHPENVFSSMETIMTLVLEESEDISLELLAPILTCLKKDNEEVLPIARKLGERVFESCALKLRTCLKQAVKSSGLSLDDYSKVIASICEGTNDSVQHNDGSASGAVGQLADESKLARASPGETAQVDDNKLTSASLAMEAEVDKEILTDLAALEEANPDLESSPKSVMGNGVGDMVKDCTPPDPKSSNMLDDGGHTSQPMNTGETGNIEPDDTDAEKLVKSVSKPEQAGKRRGRKPSSSVNLIEPSDSPQADIEKETERLADCRKSRSREAHSKTMDDRSIDVAVPLEKEKETGIQPSSPKTSVSEAVNVVSPSPNGGLPEENRPRRPGRPKKKENLIKEVPSSDVSKKASEVTSDSEVKPHKRMGKKTPVGVASEGRTLAFESTSKDEGGATSDSEAKLLKPLGLKVDASDNVEYGSSSGKKEDGKRRGRGKASAEKDKKKSSAKDDDKEVVSSPKSTTKLAKDEDHLEKAPKTNSKRKRTSAKENATNSVVYDGNLVGSKIKVFWPDDKRFYDGVIDSFDPFKKKYKVLYVDGDEETLNLKKERWEFIEGDSDPVLHGDQATESPSPDDSSERHKKKRAKTSSELPSKQGKLDVSPKRGGGSSSSQLKGAASKSGRKPKYDSKVGSNSRDNTSKAGGKSEDDITGKSRDHSQRTGGKTVDDGPKIAGKSKNIDSGTPKSGSKSKQDTGKAAKESPNANTKDTLKAAAKAKTPKSANKSSVNGTGKVKSNLSKLKETEHGKEKSPDLVKTPESMTGKSPKARESEAKSGKKRRRRVKS